MKRRGFLRRLPAQVAVAALAAPTVVGGTTAALAQGAGLPAIAQFPSVHHLRLNLGDPGPLVFVARHHPSGPFLGAHYQLDPGDWQSPDDNGTVIVDAGGRRWRLALGGQPITPLHFGAFGTSGFDDTAAMAGAIAAAGAGGAVYLPATVRTSRTLYPLDGQFWSGPGIVAFDPGMPKTRHDADAFAVDLRDIDDFCWDRPHLHTASGFGIRFSVLGSGAAGHACTRNVLRNARILNVNPAGRGQMSDSTLSVGLWLDGREHGANTHAIYFNKLTLDLVRGFNHAVILDAPENTPDSGANANFVLSYHLEDFFVGLTIQSYGNTVGPGFVHQAPGSTTLMVRNGAWGNTLDLPVGEPGPGSRVYQLAGGTHHNKLVAAGYSNFDQGGVDAGDNSVQ